MKMSLLGSPCKEVMMTYGEWCAQAGIQEPPDSWNRHGEKSLKKELSTQLPTAEQVRNITARFSLPEDQIAQLLGMRVSVETDPLLQHLFQIWHTVFFLEKDASAEAYSPWPLPQGMKKDAGALFRALVILSGADMMEKELSKRGLTSFLTACIEDYQKSTRKHFELHGVYGLENGIMWWLWPVFLGRVFRLGRLSYEIGFYASSYRIFEKSNGQRILLAADPEQRYDEAGHEADDGIYHPSYTETDTRVTGYSFDNTGYFKPEKITLDLTEWQPSVKPGEPILALHIPPDGKLDPQSVKDSLNEAIPFFERHFPDLAFRVFTCHSWLLNTALSSLLQPDSNILAFQSLFTIVLANTNMDALYSFVFQVPSCPIEQLVPKTGFHERVLAFVREGGILWDGFGVFPFKTGKR